MDVTIIGTGNMARGVGSRVVAGGHKLTVVGKDSQSAQAVVADIGGEGSAKTAVTGDPLEGDVVVLAVYYPDARRAVEQYGDQLAGKIVVDITNPVNDTVDGLVVPADGSATHELASLATEARFVKAFNTTFAGTLTAGEVAGHEPSRSSPEAGLPAALLRRPTRHSDDRRAAGRRSAGAPRLAPAGSGAARA